jgi:serine/threonine-protein kinase HipA
MTERIQVAVELNGTTVRAGTIHVETARTLSSTFTYDPAYLARRDSYPIDPQLRLQTGPNHVRGLPGTFSDAAPDRWGRNLIRRRASKQGNREPSELDFLLGVSDDTRQGSLRFRHDADGPYLADHVDTPKLIQMPRLLRAADRVARSAETDDDIRTLLEAGTASLGGARPKASVAADDHLHIAKFPHYQDRWDVMAWESTALDLAEQAGINTAKHRILQFDEGAVLLLERFDRDGRTRIGYMSAMALLGARDGQSMDYLDIADEMAILSASPKSDLRELWTRMAFNVAINNTDDHLRNHGFIRTASGWRLAPAFDLNPNPGAGVRQTSIAGEIEKAGCAEAVLESAAVFGLSPDDTANITSRIGAALRSWRQIAARNGVRKSKLDEFETAISPEIFTHFKPKVLGAGGQSKPQHSARAKTTPASNSGSFAPPQDPGNSAR